MQTVTDGRGVGPMVNFNGDSVHEAWFAPIDAADVAYAIKLASMPNGIGSDRTMQTILDLMLAGF